jgi:isochorismate synthase
MKSTILSSSQIIHNEAKHLQNLLQYALAKQYPLALWRLPVSVEGGNRHFIMDYSGKANLVKPDIAKLPQGFLVSPFVQEDEKVYFIKADYHYQSQNTENSSILAIENQIVANYPTSTENIQDSTQEDFEEIVNIAIVAMKQGKFQKVVLSRTKTEALPANFDLALAFDKLCHLYPHAFISVVSSPEFGTWIGASPEILISSDKNKIFRTIALAGTQPKGDITNLQDALWRQKEIEEQALVSRYIINCLKKIRVREFEEDGPKTVVAGNLMHLRTDFEIDTEAVNFPELPTVMLNLLHPTSAVCGMPKPDTLAFILNHEKHHRRLYAGFLGTVNINQETHLFVNLRCMEVDKNQAIMYAGAGITKDSVPEREWNETELKCKTIAQILQTV